jgi:hypothetical protein
MYTYIYMNIYLCIYVHINIYAVDYDTDDTSRYRPDWIELIQFSSSPFLCIQI